MTTDIAGAFEEFDTGVVSDALDDHGIDGVVGGLAPVAPGLTTTGRAHTVRLERVETPGDRTNFPYAMLDELRDGRVLVVDGVGPDVSCWGGNASVLAENAGVNGVVVNGGYRDVPEIRDGTFPVFGRAPTPKTGQRRVAVAEVGGPLDLDGVAVRPDDVVVADATGVVVVPADAAAAVAETAAETLDEEAAVTEKIAAGATVSDLQRDDHEF